MITKNSQLTTKNYKMKDDTLAERKYAFHIWMRERLWDTFTIKNIGEVYEKIVGEQFDTYHIGLYHEGGNRPKLIDVKKIREGFTNDMDEVRIVPSDSKSLLITKDMIDDK